MSKQLWYRSGPTFAPLRNLRDRATYGATPGTDPGSMLSWINDKSLQQRYCQLDIYVNSLGPARVYDFRLGDDVERRMFLLFVAEAEGL